MNKKNLLNKINMIERAINESKRNISVLESELTSAKRELAVEIYGQIGSFLEFKRFNSMLRGKITGFQNSVFNVVPTCFVELEDGKTEFINDPSILLSKDGSIV